MKTYLLLALLVTSNSFAATYSSDIPYPFYAEHTASENELIPLHRGEESFQARLDMINRAKSTIEVEYFIYNTDKTGKLLTLALINAAKRGVKVRILVDRMGAYLDAFYARELEQFGIEVKHYGTSTILKPSSIHYRNHRKLIVVDDQEALTGGRNIGDEYFNLAKYNYEDRDVTVKGPMAKVMRESFDAYFNDPISKKLKYPKRPAVVRTDRGAPNDLQQKNYDKKVKAAKAFIIETDKDIETRELIAAAAEDQKSRQTSFVCPETTFSTDSPGALAKEGRKDDYEKKYRHIRKTFLDKILPIDKSLIISSPYWIANDRNQAIFDDILKRGINMEIYTNSLRSTDAIYMSANLYLHLKKWIEKGLKVSLSDALWTGNDESTLEIAKKGSWGTHAKTHVYETSTYSEIMIGSYNIDNRSDMLNTEIAVFCKGNDDLTKNVKDDIEAIAKKGIKVVSIKEAYDRNGKKINVTGASSFKRTLMNIVTVPSDLLKDLL